MNNRMPKPSEIEANLKKMDDRIAQLTHSARTESDLNELSQLRQARQHEADRLIAAQNIANDQAKIKADLLTRINEEVEVNHKEYKKLIKLATESLPPLVATRKNLASLSDIAFNLSYQVGLIQTLVGQYNSYDEEALHVETHSLKMNLVINYLGELDKIINKLAEIVPKPKTKETEETKDKPEQPPAEA